MRTAFLYSEQYVDYEYGATHPLKVERLRLTHDLCKAYGLFELKDTALVVSKPAKEADILQFHDGGYVDVLKQASRGEWSGPYAYGLGPGDNPIFPGLWEWSRLHTGASLMGAEMICDGDADIAFNIAGGLHHAGNRQASGFCYVNDPVLAVLVLLERGLRVIYLDIDAHHGDGVQWAFYEDPRVLTISFHQDGRTLFPGTGSVQETGKGKGSGFSVNVPMYPGTDDSVFWEGFSRLVPRLMDQFKPDVVVSQLGVDAFWNDPLASLELTTHGFCRVISYLVGLGKPWLALGGGGYHVANVARAWTLAWALMNQVELPEEIPHEMLGPMGEAGHHGNKLRDSGDECRRREACAQFMVEVLTYLEQHVLPNVHA